jgi:hypothetical protein
MTEHDDKIALTVKRAELIESLKPSSLSPEDRSRIQAELSLVNATIKAINTTKAAQDKAAADRKRVAGLAEAQANAARARGNAGLVHHYRDDLACPACGTDSTVGCITGSDDADDDDPGQTSAIDSWVDAVLLRHDVDFTRTPEGDLSLDVAPKWAAVIGTLVDGVYAAARGQELPDLPKAELKAVTARKPFTPPKPAKTAKPAKSAKKR